MAGDHVIGIDVGTSGTKVLLVDAGGHVVAAHTEPYPLSTPRPQWSEQDPADWWRATVIGVCAVLEDANIDGPTVRAVGLTGQMHGLVLLDENAAVLRPAMLWNDQRTAAECAEIHERVGRDEVIAITGKPVVTGFTAPKLLWVQRHEPDVFARVRSVLLPKDYVRFMLTGARAIDVADASGTSWLDLRTRAWSPSMLGALDVPEAWLPRVHEGAEVSGKLNAFGAEATRLRVGTPVVAGAGDQAAAALGCGITAPGTVSVSLGTSGVVFAASATPPADPTGAMHGFCHAVPGMWHVMGVMLSAGGSLRWFRDLWPDGPSYDDLIAGMRDTGPGAEGLSFLPYLTGERTPHDDPDARGAFIGLTLRHGRAQMTRAVVEGVTYGLRDGLDLVRGLGIDVARVRLTGGGAESAVWRQMAADVFGVDVVTVNTMEGAAFGAAILAAVGAGFHADVPAATNAWVQPTGVTPPGPDAAAYAEPYARFRALYPALASLARESRVESRE